MNNLGAKSGWDEIPQIETTTELKGGPGGALNSQAQALLNRLTALNDTLQLSDFAALRAYKGPRKSVYVTGVRGTAAPTGIAGIFVCDDSDKASADNGGTVIVAANDKRWKRQFNGGVVPEWFGATGEGLTEDWSALNAAANCCRATSEKLQFLTGRTYLIGKSLDLTGIHEIDMAGSLIRTNFDSASAVMVGGFTKYGKIRVAVRSLSDMSTDPASRGLLIKKASGSDFDLDVRGYSAGVVVSGTTGDFFVKNRVKLRSMSNNGTQVLFDLSGNAYAVHNDFYCGSMYLGTNQTANGRATVLYRLAGTSLASDNNFYDPEIGIDNGSITGTDHAALFRGEISTTTTTNSVYFRHARLEFYSQPAGTVTNGVVITGNTGRIAVKVEVISKTGILATSIPDSSSHDVDMSFTGLWAQNTQFDAVPVVPDFGPAYQSGNVLRVPNAVIYDEAVAAYGVEQDGITSGLTSGATFARGDGSLFLSPTNVAIGRVYNKATSDTTFIRLQGGRQPLVLACWDSAGNVLGGSNPHYVAGRNRRSVTRGIPVYEMQSDWLHIHKDVAKFFIGFAAWAGPGMLVDTRVQQLFGANITLEANKRANLNLMGAAAPVRSFMPVGTRIDSTNVSAGQNSFVNRFHLETSATAATAAAGNVLLLASTAGVAVGDTIGVQTDALIGTFKQWRCYTVAAVSGLNVTLSANLPAGVGVATGNAVLFNRWRANFIAASASYDPPSLAPGTSDAEQTLPIAGAVVGDYVEATSLTIDARGVEIKARVSTADTVKYFAHNPAGNPNGTVDLTQHSVLFRVMRKG